MRFTEEQTGLSLSDKEIVGDVCVSVCVCVCVRWCGWEIYFPFMRVLLSVCTQLHSYVYLSGNKAEITNLEMFVLCTLISKYVCERVTERLGETGRVKNNVCPCEHSTKSSHVCTVP